MKGWASSLDSSVIGKPYTQRAQRGSPPDVPPGWRRQAYLKADLFSRVERGTYTRNGVTLGAVRRDTRYGRWWLRPLALLLHRREAAALERIVGLAAVPQLLYRDRFILVRSWVEGRPLHEAQPGDPAYFHSALRLLIRLHRAGVAHDDLAKQPNWLVMPDGTAALVDFQLATVRRWRTRWFRMLAREDLRHLLKHKRRYCRQHLTARQWAMLRSPALASRIWMRTYKPVYRLITRRILRWSDREGAGDRHW